VRPTIKMFVLMVWYGRISMPEDCRPRDAEQHSPLRYAEYQRQYGIDLGVEAILKYTVLSFYSKLGMEISRLIVL